MSLKSAKTTPERLAGWTACTSSENSEVLPLGSVAVALIHSPGVVAARPLTLKLALPEPSVITLAEPR